MLPLETVKVSSELLRPLARRFMPQALARCLGRLGVRLGQWSRATQARLPEPVVLCIKLLAAWILLPLIVLAFLFAPGVGKIMVGALLAAAARRREQSPKP